MPEIFKDVSSPIQAPVFPNSGLGGLGVGAIVGIAVGAAVVLALAGYGGYRVFASGGGGERLDDKYESSNPPDKLHVMSSGEDISMLDGPTHGVSSAGNDTGVAEYGDQRYVCASSFLSSSDGDTV